MNTPRHEIKSGRVSNPACNAAVLPATSTGVRAHRRRPPAAFSLIEVMCAVAILAVALVGFTQAMSIALTSSKESELQTTAAWLAAGLIETLRADGLYTDGESEGEGSGAYAIYRYKQTISRTSIDGLHEVVVEVANKSTGQPIYELRTMLFEPPSDTTPRATDNRRDTSNASTRGGRR